MILANPYGGFGNQLFGYAFARMIAQQTGETIYMSRLRFQEIHKNLASSVEYIGDYYKLGNTKILKGKVGEAAVHYCGGIYRHLIAGSMHEGEELTVKEFLIHAKYGYYQSRNTLSLCNNIRDLPISSPLKYIEGLFQWPAFFEPIHGLLKMELQIIKQLSLKNINYLNQIKHVNSVCVHIRRGDYLKYRNFQVCNYEYYKNAMEWIAAHTKEPIFFVFSDEIEWVQQNYKFPYPHIFIMEKNIAPYELELMRNCKHFIMSNSTFSWWAQYLSWNEHSIVVAPSPWFADGRQTAVYQKRWHVIQSNGGMDL